MKFALAVINSVKNAVSSVSRPFVIGYRLSPEEIETPGIRLEDSLYFAEKIRDLVDYIHISMGSYRRTSLNDKRDVEPILQKFAKITSGHTPLIGVGSVELPADADNVLALGTDFVALGRELLREPQWVQKIAADDEDSIRTRISPSDMAELAIPSVMQVYLSESFKSVMHFTTDTNTKQDYRNQVAPMEGFEKKL